MYSIDKNDEIAYDLISKMIHPFYWERYTIEDCLKHNFFNSSSETSISKSKQTMAKKKQLELFPNEETQVQEPQLEIQPINWYEFDWTNKIQTVDDLKVIFSSLRMTVSEKAEEFDTLKKYLKDDVAYTTN